jgi:hypothetical protein
MFIIAKKKPTMTKYLLAILSDKKKVVPIFSEESDARMLHGLLEAEDKYGELSILKTDSALIDNLERNKVSYVILDGNEFEIPTSERCYTFIA